MSTDDVAEILRPRPLSANAFVSAIDRSDDILKSLPVLLLMALKNQNTPLVKQVSVCICDTVKMLGGLLDSAEINGLFFLASDNKGNLRDNTSIAPALRCVQTCMISTKALISNKHVRARIGARLANKITGEIDRVKKSADLENRIPYAITKMAMQKPAFKRNRVYGFWDRANVFSCPTIPMMILKCNWEDRIKGSSLCKICGKSKFCEPDTHCAQFKILFRNRKLDSQYLSKGIDLLCWPGNKKVLLAKHGWYYVELTPQRISELSKEMDCVKVKDAGC